MFKQIRKSTYPSITNSHLSKASSLQKRIGSKRNPLDAFSRCKTEENESDQSMFPLELSLKKRYSTSQKNPRKEYVMIRQQRLKKEYDDFKLKLNKGDLSLPLKKPAQLSSTSEEERMPKRPIFSQKVSQLSRKQLECNMLHLMKIFEGILKKKDPKVLIQKVKGYILEEESDLNEVQLCLEDKSDQLLVKSILFNERVLQILLVECVIHKKYRFNQQNFLQLFKDFTLFYYLIYLQFSGKQLNKFLQIHHIKSVLPYMPHKNHDFELRYIKEGIAKRVTTISKQFPELDNFISRQTNSLKSSPSNLNYYKLLQFYAAKLTGGSWNSWNIEFLETCPSPYIHYETEKKYTLLLDLDETLVHYRNTTAKKGEFLLRPHLFSFLSKLQPYFQIGIFTCAMQVYADVILEHLPAISFRLYRQHTVKFDNEMYKDLSRVGRDLSKVLLVDNLEKNFDLQKDNGIHVRSWYGDPKDSILQDLGVELQKLISESPNDLRKSTHKRSFL